MGFFSSIGNAIKKTVGKVGDFISDSAGGILSAAGDLASGLLGNSASADTNAAQIQLTREQMAYQRELAQNQIQWRVEDAKKAGLHPLAGLGVSSASYSPVSTDLTPADYSFLGDMGQNLNRAIMQGKTSKERQQALARQNQYDDIMMRKANAEADLAETTAASERLRLHRELFPPSPVTNASQDSQLPNNNTFGPTTHNLYSIARYGDILLTALNPDIADSLTESQVAHLSATLTREVENERNPRIWMDAVRHLPKTDQKAVVDGRAVLDYVPAVGGYVLTYRKQYHRNRKGYATQVSGALRF